MYAKALKVCWIRQLTSETNPKWKQLFQTTYPFMDNLNIFGACYLEKKLCVDNPFWKNCFKSFVDFDKKVKPDSYSVFLTEPIFYNPHIKVYNKPIFIKQWWEKGVTQIIDLVDEKKEFLSFEEFEKMYQMSTNFLFFHGIVKSIKQYLKYLSVNRSQCDMVLDYRCTLQKLQSQ